MADNKKDKTSTKKKSVKKNRVGEGLKSLLGADNAPKIVRSMIQGWTIDEAQVLFKAGKPNKEDLSRATERLRELYNAIDNFEASTKKELYQILIAIKKRGMHLILDENGIEKSIAKFLIDDCGRNRSTSYKDAKLVEFIIEYSLEHTLTEDKIKDVLFKMREIMYKPEDSKKILIPQLETVTRKEIAQHGKQERSKWVGFSRFKGRLRRNKDNSLNIEIIDKEVVDDVEWIMKRWDRATIKKVKDMLGD